MNRYGHRIFTRESSPVFAGGGSTCRLHLTRPAIYQFFKSFQRGILGMTLSGSLSLSVPAVAQTLQEIGRWHWLEINQNTVATWRKGPQRVYDQNYTVHEQGPADAWKDTFGIHAALLPETSLSGAGKHGWVILWGYGHQRHVNNEDRLLATDADPFYPSSCYVSRAAMTPFLLWHPDDTTTTGNAKHYGYARYLFDTDLWSEVGDWPIFKMFCAGHAFLPDGKLYLAGGDGDLFDGSNHVAGYVGLRLQAIFNPFSFDRFSWNAPLWSVSNAMREPRWYPTVIALPDGRLLIVGGKHFKITQNPPENSEFYEVYDPCTGALADEELPADPEIFRKALGSLYPRLHVVSYLNSAGNGLDIPRVVFTGPEVQTFWLDALQPDSAWMDYPQTRNRHRTWGSSILLPNPVENPQGLGQQVLNQVMVVGGDNGASVTHTTEIMTFGAINALSIAYGPAMDKQRMHVNTVLLPTGDILVVGGIKRRDSQWRYERDDPEDPTDVVFATEMFVFNPSTGQYAQREVAPAPQDDRDGGQDPVKDGARVYHSTAMLLPNGSVLTTGSADVDSVGRRVQNRVPLIYSPPYLYLGNELRSETQRPQITSLSAIDVNYGNTFIVDYQLPSGANSIRSVVMMRPGSVTHSFNFEQRLIRLNFKEASPQLEVTAPWDPAIAPPGYYMLFIIDNTGTPSIAKWIRIKALPCEDASPMRLTIELQGVAPQTSVERADRVAHSPIRLDVCEPWSGEVIETYTLPMFAPDEQGRVFLSLYTDLPESAYSVYFAPYRSWLGKRISLDWQRDERLLVSLTNGDVNGDNSVDVLDLEIALSQMGSQDSAVETTLSGDLNLDGVVDTQDIDILLTHFGARGDQ